MQVKIEHSFFCKDILRGRRSSYLVRGSSYLSKHYCERMTEDKNCKKIMQWSRRERAQYKQHRRWTTGTCEPRAAAGRRWGCCTSIWWAARAGWGTKWSVICRSDQSYNVWATIMVKCFLFLTLTIIASFHGYFFWFYIMYILRFKRELYISVWIH